jgi:DNA primase
VALSRQIGEAMSAMRRLAADPSADRGASRELAERLQGLQRSLVDLRARLA